jgi:hypothetical protein
MTGQGRRPEWPKRACDWCGAGLGERCRVWKVEGGERTYVIRSRSQPHPARMGR